MGSAVSPAKDHHQSSPLEIEDLDEARLVPSAWQPYDQSAAQAGGIGGPHVRLRALCRRSQPYPDYGHLAASGQTMVVVTHEMGFARRVATRAIVLAEGLIAEEGSPADVLDAPRTAATRALLGNGRGV
jgi:hypothetical protein